MGSAVRDRSVSGKAAKLASPPRKQLGSQPDAAGHATRLAAARLQEAGIVLEPLLRKAGLSVDQIDHMEMRIGVASQIKFLDLAAQALNDPLLGFRLARDGELRNLGLLYYAAASSETLGEALGRAQRYSSIVNAGVVLQCSQANDFTIALRYFGVARHSDRQQMEMLVTTLIRICRALTGESLKPTLIRLVHGRSGGFSEVEKFFGCKIEFGAETDQIIFDKRAAQLPLVGSDPYLNEILLQYCEAALAQRQSNVSSLRVSVENAITPLLPHGKARLDAVARKFGMSRRTLARRLMAEGLSFNEILNQLRSDLAKLYLRERTLSISQIAWLVGFQGVGAFSHGCRRWTGMNPKSIRAQLLASD
jgi:AraC-like DNA-binding protein